MDWDRRMCGAQNLQICFSEEVLIYWLLAMSISGALTGLGQGTGIRYWRDLAGR